MGGLVGQAAYRVGQFRLALSGRVSQDEMREARDVLGPRLYEIFERMPGQYRHHMLRVYRRIREAGCEDRNVWQAALLHDSGKHDPDTGRYVTIPYRVLVVVLEATGPGRGLLRRLSQPAGNGNSKGPARRMGWRYPLYLHRRHAELGARRAKAYGAHGEVVALIRDHGRKTGERSAGLSALQAADDES